MLSDCLESANPCWWIDDDGGDGDASSRRCRSYPDEGFVAADAAEVACTPVPVPSTLSIPFLEQSAATKLISTDARYVDVITRNSTAGVYSHFFNENF